MATNRWTHNQLEPGWEREPLSGGLRSHIISLGLDGGDGCWQASCRSTIGVDPETWTTSTESVHSRDTAIQEARICVLLFLFILIKRWPISNFFVCCADLCSIYSKMV